ncbi:T9SS type A sorting domain-containing protein [Bacteroides sp.]
MKKFTVLLMCVIASLTQMYSQNYAEVWLEKFHFEKDEDIVVHYSGGFGNAKDYMGIAPLGQEITGVPGGYTTTYAYFDVEGAKEGTSTITGYQMGNAPEGYYWVAYLLNDGYERASAYVPFYYGENAPQNESPVMNLEECTTEYTVITFTDNKLWRNLIKEISVDGTAISTDVYTMESGALYILADLTTASFIKITAWDHPDVILQFKSTAVEDKSTACDVQFIYNLLQITNNDAMIQSVSVISLTGVTIESYQIGTGDHQFDLNHLDPGIYFIKAIGKGMNKVIKIVIE